MACCFVQLLPFPHGRLPLKPCVHHHHQKLSLRCNSTRFRMQTKQPPSRPALLTLATGVTLLTATLTNRLFFTPLQSLSPFQSRSDILGILASTTLILHALATADIIPNPKKPIPLDGVDVKQGFDDGVLSLEVDWGFQALMRANPFIKSCTLFVNGTGIMFLGRFRQEQVKADIKEGGIVEKALREGQRAYLADMKTVPVKDVEFGFLPANCQAVIVQPVSDKAVLVLAADKPRPFRSQDFGWLQVATDRIGAAISNRS